MHISTKEMAMASEVLIDVVKKVARTNPKIPRIADSASAIRLSRYTKYKRRSLLCKAPTAISLITRTAAYFSNHIFEKEEKEEEEEVEVGNKQTG